MFNFFTKFKILNPEKHEIEIEWKLNFKCKNLKPFRAGIKCKHFFFLTVNDFYTGFNFACVYKVIWFIEKAPK